MIIGIALMPVGLLLAVASASIAWTKWLRTGLGFFLATMCFVSLLFTACGRTAGRLHARVEDAVASGGYGPPDRAREMYASEIESWHSSATYPALSALVAGTILVLLALVPRRYGFRWKQIDPAAVRRLRPWELGGLAVAVATGLYCLYAVIA